MTPRPEGRDILGAPVAAAPSREQRRRIIREGLVIGAVTGAYGTSFGAVAVAAGFSPLQACALSLLMFTGGSQFAMVGTVAAGGTPMAGAATAALLGLRNAFYGLRLAPLLRPVGLRRLGAAHLVIDESAAMGAAHGGAGGPLAFWATGLSVFIGWNAMTLVGALGATAIDDPRVLGLDVAGPAAFVVLARAQMGSSGARASGRELIHRVAAWRRAPQPWVVALVAALLALASAPMVAAGIPILVAAGVAVVGGWRPARAEPCDGSEGPLPSGPSPPAGGR